MRCRAQALAPLVVTLLFAGPAHGGAFLLSSLIQKDLPDAVVHPVGYDGTGGLITINICINPTSPHASDLMAPAARAISTLDDLIPTTGNYVPIGQSTQVPASTFDAESVLLHEISHCLGVHHGNKPPGLSEAQKLAFSNATMSAMGPDNAFSFVFIGLDNTWGSADDLRDDDINLFWFRKMNNDPFALPGNPPPPYDQTMYTRDLAQLPASDSFAANGTPQVATNLGYPNTKSVMHAQTGPQSEFRSLTHDEITMLRYAMSGLNEVAGDADDYDYQLQLSTYPCDIPIAMASLGQDDVGKCTSINSGPIEGSTDHYTLVPIGVQLNSDFPFFFGSALDLVITVTDADAEVLPGSDISYTLEVSNVGSGVDATGVEITETVPDNTTFNAAESDPGWSCDAATPGSECLLAVGSLTAGGPSVQATFVVTVDNPMPGGVEEIFNLVRISDDGSNGPDSNVGNNNAQESTPVLSIVVYNDGFESGGTSFWSATVP